MTNDAQTILTLARTLYSTPCMMVAAAVHGDAPHGYIEQKANAIRTAPLRWIGTLEGAELDRLARFVRDIAEPAPTIR